MPQSQTLELNSLLTLSLCVSKVQKLSNLSSLCHIDLKFGNSVAKRNPIRPQTGFCFHFCASLCVGWRWCNDLHGLGGAAEAWVSTVSPPAGSAPTGRLQDGKMAKQKATLAGFSPSSFLSIDVCIWSEAVLQPDHRHKLTTCVPVHQTDEVSKLWDALRLQDLCRKCVFWDAKHTVWMELIALASSP